MVDIRQVYKNGKYSKALILPTSAVLGYYYVEADAERDGGFRIWPVPDPIKPGNDIK